MTTATVESPAELETALLQALNTLAHEALAGAAVSDPNDCSINIADVVNTKPSHRILQVSADVARNTSSTALQTEHTHMAPKQTKRVRQFLRLCERYVGISDHDPTTLKLAIEALHSANEIEAGSEAIMEALRSTIRECISLVEVAHNPQEGGKQLFWGRHRAALEKFVVLAEQGERLAQEEIEQILIELSDIIENPA